MTSRLKSSGIAALSFTLSAGILALALTPAMAQAAGTEAEPIDLTATADRDREVRTRIVDASDVDFTNAADLKRLNSRINGAVNDVCRDQGDGRATIGSGRCYVEARLSANRQVTALRNSATLLAAAGSVKGARAITIASR